MRDKTEEKKPDLRDPAAPATSLRDTDTVGVEQGSQTKPSSPGTVKPGGGAQAEGQTTRSS